MVGYDPKNIQLTKIEHAIVGTLTGVLSRAIIQPFDVLKIRFQTQHEPISIKSNISKYKSLTQAINVILKEEGIKSFWKGHLTGQILSSTYALVQFSSFEFFTFYSYKLTHKTVEDVSLKSLTHFLCGGLSASVATLINQPIDTIRTRFVVQGEPRVYKSISHAFISLYKNEGIKGFYKGLIPSILLVAPQTALTFSLYTLLNNYYDKLITKNYDKNKNVAIRSAINGALSGIIAKSLIYPFDVVKKRLQIQGFENARSSFGVTAKYKGTLDCFKKILKYEGINGIYKGYWPSMLKAGVSTSSIFLLYEEITLILRLIKS